MIVLKRTASLLMQCVITIEILIFIGVSPVLFHNLSFNPQEFFQAVYHETIRIFTLDHLTADGQNPLFPVLFDKYLDSMRILGLGIVAAAILSLLAAYIIFLFFRKKINLIHKLMELFEAVPDLVFILLLQMAVIIIYRKTGIKLAQVVTVRDKTILLPVISLAVPISFYITKVLVHNISEEMGKNYIELVKAKGFSYFYILNMHVLRNILDGFFGTSKTIFWSMLSTLLVIDYLFNMNGLLTAMLRTTDAFIAGCMMIFIPFFILYRIYDWFSFERRKDAH